MDWMTGSIVVIGIVILCVFVVIPTQEFAQILRRLGRKARPVNLDTPDDSVRSPDDDGGQAP
jgi:hypothetical protein